MNFFNLRHTAILTSNNDRDQKNGQKKIQIAKKSPKIDMEMSEVGKNCNKSLNIAKNGPVYAC